MELNDGSRVTSTRATIDGELDLVRSAISMVAGRASRRVTLGGLRFGVELLPEATRQAELAGVRARALWSVDDAGCDIAIEAV